MRCLLDRSRNGRCVINTLAKLPDAAITPYVDVIFALAALTLSWLLLRARLVPGWLAIWGLAGGALYLAQGAAAAFGPGWGPLMVPLAVQEITLAIWLIAKGFTENLHVCKGIGFRTRGGRRRSTQNGAHTERTPSIFELAMDRLRFVTCYASREGAQEVRVIFEAVHPEDARPLRRRRR